MRATAAGLAAGLLLGLAACTGDPGPTPPAASPPPASAGPSGLSEPGAWRRLAPAPTPRTEVAAAAAGNRIVVVGGYTGDGATVPTTEILDLATGRWSRGPDLPVRVNHAMAASVDGVVYVFGGRDADRAPVAAAHRLVDGGWRPVAALPEARSAGTAVALGGRVYVAGGVAPGGLATRMLVYDVAADRWTTAPGPPTPREHLGGAAAAGLVHTVGGRRGGLDTNLATVEAYDPGTGRWSARPDLPTARGGLAATATRCGRVVAIGGEAAATFREVEVYDPATRAWSAGPPLPTPRHGLGVVAVGDTVYTLSGGPTPGLHVSAATEALELSC
jgi:non-specific serine/threonine protein kinase